MSPPGFSPPQPIDLAILRYIPNAVGAIAYGVYVSPEYRVPGEYIPAVGTLRETPPVQGYNELYFTLFLPSGPRPAAGWPVAIVGTAGDQHFATGAVAAMLASHGIATIGINVVGNGFGPLGTLAITTDRRQLARHPRRGAWDRPERRQRDRSHRGNIGGCPSDMDHRGAR